MRRCGLTRTSALLTALAFVSVHDQTSIWLDAHLARAISVNGEAQCCNGKHNVPIQAVENPNSALEDEKENKVSLVEHFGNVGNEEGIAMAVRPENDEMGVIPTPQNPLDAGSGAGNSRVNIPDAIPRIESDQPTKLEVVANAQELEKESPLDFLENLKHGFNTDRLSESSRRRRRRANRGTGRLS